LGQSSGIYHPSGNTPDGQSAGLASTSKALPVFLKYIDARPDAHILDLGPVCGENINFLSRRVRKLSICDMFIRLNRQKEKGQAYERIWRHLDYEAKMFDGILMWDLPDRLGNDAASAVGDNCRRILKPGGLVMACALDEKEDTTDIHTFVIENDLHISFRRQPHLNLPLYVRKTRKIINTMAPLKLVQSSLFRNGLREFIFRETG